MTALNTLRAHNIGKRISFVSGNFKVIHAGHIRLLRYAREMADMLVVGVLPQNTFNASVSERDRLHNVLALNMVDHAYLMTNPLEEDLRALRPDVVVKGNEHENGDNVEASVMEEFGGKLVFSSGPSLLQEADLHTDGAKVSPLQLRYPQDFLDRHHMSVGSLRQVLEHWQGMRIVVVGDVIVDEYINCDPLGMSQEDPTIVVSPASTQSYLGGAGIVAAHAAGLGADVHFATVCGKDAPADFVRERLESYGVRSTLVADATRPTSLKQRFRCRGKTLLRVNHLRQHGVDKDIRAQLLHAVVPLLQHADLLVFSDFNYGCLPSPLAGALTQAAVGAGVPIVADSQSSSQMGDVSRFQQAHLLTPTEREARLAVHDFESGLVVLADSLLQKAAARNVIVTLGELGVLIQQGDIGMTDQIPALNAVPKDVAGAGDSLLVAAGMTLAGGGDIWHAACLGSLAAALQVSRQGNIPLTYEDMNHCLNLWN